MDRNRTIETVLNLETGELIEADVFLESISSNEADILKLRTFIEKNPPQKPIHTLCEIFPEV